MRLRPAGASDLARLHALWTLPDVRRYLFAREAARLVLGYAFGELGFGEVAADVDEPNVESIALLKRLGFVVKESPRPRTTAALSPPRRRRLGGVTGA